MKFVKIIAQSKNLDRYKNIVGKVAKVVEDNPDYETLAVLVKNVRNEKSTFGYFYVNREDVTEITEKEYDNFLVKPKTIYVCRCIHIESFCSTKAYNFVSSEKFDVHDEVIGLNARQQRVKLCVTDCKPIFEDQVEEFMEEHNLGHLSPIIAKIETKEIVVKNKVESKIDVLPTYYFK